MVRLELSTQLSYEVLDAGCDFIFSIQAARTSRQKVVGESLQLILISVQDDLNYGKLWDSNPWSATHGKTTSS